MMFLSRNKAGFTLFELMVVLVLIGLMSSMVFISVSSGIFKSKEKRFVYDFRKCLLSARNRAIGTGRPVNFIIDGDKRVFGIKGKRLKEIPRSLEIKGDKIIELEDGIFAITFYPDGSSSGGELELNWENGRDDLFIIGRIFAYINHEIKSS